MLPAPASSSTACAVGDEHEVDLEEGKRLILGLQAISEPDERGMRTVMCTINGQLRPVQVRDRVGRRSTSPAAEKADPGDAGHVAAPFAGVVTLAVAEGDTVEAGAAVATIEAMKMEAVDHRAGRRHRAAAGHRPARSRSRAATWCSCVG